MVMGFSKNSFHSACLIILSRDVKSQQLVFFSSLGAKYSSIEYDSKVVKIPFYSLFPRSFYFLDENRC
jgi:transposase